MVREYDRIVASPAESQQGKLHTEPVGEVFCGHLWVHYIVWPMR